MNSDPQKNLSSIEPQLNFTKNQELGDIPIHTMKKDLANVNNPQYFDEPEPVSVPKQSFRVEDSSQRTSPFLSQETKKEIPAATPEMNTPGPKPHSPSGWGKLILVSFLIFLFFAAGAGGYYYWINKKKSPAVQENITVTPPEPTLATDKPNYLNLDLSSEKIDIASSVDKYIQEMKEENLSSPIEFSVVDNQNNPISFKDFSLKTGLTLPEEIISNLKDNFSLFIYQEEGQPRLGISVDSSDLIGTSLKEALKKNELTLASSLAPLYLEGLPPTDETPFGTSYYGGAEIRYKNINSPSSLSLDYTIFRDKLVIATSKMTLRSIIDYVSAHGKVQGAEDVLENIPEEELQNGQFSR